MRRRCSTARAGALRRAVRRRRPAPTRWPAAPSTRCSDVARYDAAARRRWSRCCKARRRSCRTPRTRCTRYLRRTEPDPQRLAELDERLSAWMALARRYRRPPAELPALLAQLASTSCARSTPPPTWPRCERAATRRRARLATPKPQRVGKRAATAAPKLAAAVTQAMQQLGMAGGRFEVALRAQDAAAVVRPGERRVPGRRPRRQHAAAAGQGGLGRRAVAPGAGDRGDHQPARRGGDGAGTLIFDEIDAGVGGAVAETVGRLMKQLGPRPPGAGRDPPGRRWRPAPTTISSCRKALQADGARAATCSRSPARRAWPRSRACWAASACRAPAWPMRRSMLAAAPRRRAAAAARGRKRRSAAT